MTTIVANLECMAADQRCTGCGPMFHMKKLHRIGHSIFGLAGEIPPALVMIEWLKTKRNVPQLHKLIPEAHRYEFQLLELSPGGLALWDGWGMRTPILDACYAIGSGSMSALQALRLNCDPAHAVLQAMALDEYSGVISEPEVEALMIPKRKRAK